MASLYPGALDTTDSLYAAVNGLKSILTADTDSNAAIIYFLVPTGVPSTGYVTIKGEAIHYTGKNAVSITGCTRGQDGTAKAAHFKNDEVDFGPVADHHNVLTQAIFAIEAKLGTGSAGQINGAQLVANSIPASKLQGGLALGYRVRVYHMGVLACPTNTNTRLPLNTLSGVDPQAMWDAVNTRIVCVKDGTYSVKGASTVAPVGGTVPQLALMLFKNGLEISRGSQFPNATVGTTPTLLVNDDVPMVVGDYLDLYVVSLGQSSALWQPGGSSFNFISVALLP